MATITTKKEIAVKRIQGKIIEGQTLLRKLSSEIEQTEHKVILNEYDTWRSSCFNTLRQIFSDEVLANKYFGDEDIIPSEETLTEKVSHLKMHIKKDITKLEHTINDLNHNLYTQISDKEKIGFWTTIIVALITALGGVITGYIASPKKTDAQGLENVSLDVNGKWKYICTSFDGSYQHGGRFTVQKGKDGSLILHGWRMWRDTKDTITNKWICVNFEESDYLQWHTNWIYVYNDSKMNFEYEIPMKNKTVTGYCTGIIDAENKKVESVNGNFYVLNDTPILTGQIIFRKVSDEEYTSKSTLRKNH